MFFPVHCAQYSFAVQYSILLYKEKPEHVHLFCWQLSNKMDVATNASKIFELLIQYLCVEHIDYAIELGLQGQFHISCKIFDHEFCVAYYKMQISVNYSFV